MPLCPIPSFLLSLLLSSVVHLFLTSASAGLRQTHGALQAARLLSSVTNLCGAFTFALHLILPLQIPPTLAAAAGVGAALCSAAGLYGPAAGLLACAAAAAAMRGAHKPASALGAVVGAVWMPEAVAGAMREAVRARGVACVACAVVCVVAVGGIEMGEEGEEGEEEARKGKGRKKGRGKGKKVAGKSSWPALTGAVSLAVLLAFAAGGRIKENRRPALPAELTVLAQKVGPTGLISVVECARRKMRFMTCDHSVLGGIYTSPQFRGWSIFGQFHVHEAVRLSYAPAEVMVDEASRRQGGARGGRALCVGVGIGVVAGALQTFGTHVDAVEIDGVVAEFAREYFGLKVDVVVEDALDCMGRAVKEVREGTRAKYDYVVHDVFTGGAVPLALFSVETFRVIKELLDDDGILALNFVGAPEDAGSARLAVAAVATRLRVLFPYVRAFGEKDGGGVENIVYFASAAKSRMQFAKMAEEDILDSGIRENALLSFIENEIPAEVLNIIDKEKDATDEVINAGQWVTAQAHWKILRQEFGNVMWEAIAE